MITGRRTVGATGAEGVHDEAVGGGARPKVGHAARGKLDDGAVGAAEARRDRAAEVGLETAVGVRAGVVDVLDGEGARVVAAHGERERKLAELEDLARAQLDARHLLAHVARAQGLSITLWAPALHLRAPVVAQGFSAPTGRNRWKFKKAKQKTVNQSKKMKKEKEKITKSKKHKKTEWEEEAVIATR